MTANSEERARSAPRWRYLALAASIFILAGVVLAGLWQLPRAFPGLAEPGSGMAPAGGTSTPAATLTPPFTPSPTSSATATPAITQPRIVELNAAVDDETRTITFYMAAQVPPGQEVDEALLWYDTETGHRLQRTTGPLPGNVALTYELDPAQEGLTRTLTTTQELDYWWYVQDTAGASVRAGGTVFLGPALQALVTNPTPPPPPVDFTWAVSETAHFRILYMPDTAAERDLFRLGPLAESSLASISAMLAVNFDGQMDIYLVPRVFWQGGAAYSDKVQLISYLDRNYTGVETWSYLTHEGTHALAQDLIQPKEEGGGPDGVLVEGLAVWASGGHYRQEPIDAWAAAVAGSEDYLLLAELRTGPFYDFQHETSYLEGASFVKFLIERYGLGRFKELYGQATGDVDNDRALVKQLYSRDYAELEADWLAYLFRLNPSPETVAAWDLRVRSFDLMRRYETELDPDARVLPPAAPPEWLSDTLEIFLPRENAPINLVLETALIAAQERMHSDDLDGASALLDDVEAALDTGSITGQPSLQARQAIVDLVAAQDQAVLRADAGAYRATLTPGYALRIGPSLAESLQPPFTAYRQELVQLDLIGDGRIAEGAVLVHARLADGTYAADGQLFAVRFVKTGEGWLMSSRRPTEADLPSPPANGS